MNFQLHRELVPLAFKQYKGQLYREMIIIISLVNIHHLIWIYYSEF